MGIWVEDDSYVPSPGDYIFYDWDDNASGDNKGYSEHVGIVEAVENGAITVVEGNYSNAVKRRSLKVNGKYIRGYGVPKYDEDDAASKPVELKHPVVEVVELHYSIRLPKLKKGSKGAPVKALQILLIGYGGKPAQLVKAAGGADGDFGPGTEDAVKTYQDAAGLSDDGVVGPETWKELLGV
jgi:hypothetical protein